MNKVIEIKRVGAALLATLSIALTGCDRTLSVDIPSIPSASSTTETPVSEEPSVSSSTEAPMSEEPKVEASSSEASEASSQVEEEIVEVTPPTPKYSEWVLGEWTTDVFEETDTCRLANQTTQTENVWSNWSEWSTEPVSSSDTRQVETKEEYGKIIEKYVQLPKVGPDGYIIEGEYVWRAQYLKDENGHAVRGETTYYSYRDLVGTNSYTLYQYETREVLNQEELDAYQSTKKLELVKE